MSGSENIIFLASVYIGFDELWPFLQIICVSAWVIGMVLHLLTRSSNATLKAQPQDNKPLEAEIHPQATEAIRRVGRNPKSLSYGLKDIGIIVYNSNPKPTLYRNNPIPDDVSYIQPFVTFYNIPLTHNRVHFELVEEDGDVVYECSEVDLKTPDGKVIIPRTRLPMGDYLQTTQTWSLKIYVNGRILAEHLFKWFKPSEFDETLRDSMTNDGELNEEVISIVETMFSGEVSLDALLNDVDNPPDDIAFRFRT